MARRPREIVNILKIEPANRFDILPGETIPPQKPLYFKRIFVMPII
jgi:hypothetical protein